MNMKEIEAITQFVTIKTLLAVLRMISKLHLSEMPQDFGDLAFKLNQALEKVQDDLADIQLSEWIIR
ncbi:MAG: hypothetical protein ACXABY_24285 [Candidatus Thorarchaeota archaeon]|jgi:hypothetical protein